MNLEFFKKEKTFKKRNTDLNPNLYWRIIIGITFVIVIMITLYGYFLFTTTSEDFILSNQNNTKQTPVFKDGLMEKVLNYFTERENKTNKILNSPSPLVDPSL